jgi:toxin ParE1/3/4
MTGRVLRRPRVRQDIAERARFIADDSPDAAESFIDAVEHAFAMLANLPGLGASRSYVPDLRMWRVPGFEKHLIFYRPLDDGVEVIRVLHGARDLAGLFDDDGNS